MTTKTIGYLPNDRPPFGQMLLLGFQHVLTMFPATIFVALQTGFHVSTVLLASGLATIVALLLSRRGIGKFIPLYYGSSFSYIAAYMAITHASWAQPASDELIAAAQGGILVTGVLNVLVGLLIQRIGKAALDKVLPPVITGSVAAVIGFSLGFEAIKMATGIALGFEQVDLKFLLVSMITLLATILFSVYLQGKGFIGMLPVLLGAAVGYALSAALGMVDYAPLAGRALFELPHMTLPSFTGPLAGTAIFSIAVMAIATIPESTAHLYQISLYVDHLAEDTGKEKYGLDKYIGFNLVLDGIGDMINGLFGGVAGTNYGENNSLMAITRNYSGPALIMAGVISVLLSFVGVLDGFLQTVHISVSGGLAIYLFGVVGMQGVALMIEHKVNLFDPRQLAIGAVILIVGVGGHIGFPGGLIPVPVFQSVFPSGLPAIDTGAVLGILLNAVFLIFPPKGNN